MILTDLPLDVLQLLPSYIRNIEDLMNFSSTCRALHYVCAKISPRTILHLAAESAPTFFSPHPHFLVAATARQLGEWASKNEENCQTFRTACQEGIDGLYELCLKHTGLTLDRIRELHAARFTVINPFCDQIDKMAGPQWERTPNFWEGGVSEAETIQTEPMRATFQIIIYGELFSDCVSPILESSKPQSMLKLRTRLEFIKYCIPDTELNALGYSIVLETGPYAEGLWEDEDDPIDQSALRHILHCSRWKRLWAKALPIVGPDFEQEWRQKLWFDCLLTQGFDTLELVTITDKTSEKTLDKLLKIKNKISMLNDDWKAPGRHAVWTLRLSDMPSLTDEIHIWKIFTDPNVPPPE